LNPKRIIEVGCGFSSGIILDVNEFHFKNEMCITFADPYPELLREVVKEEDLLNNNINILESKAQDLELDLFLQLGENDVLFLDTTHVSKIGSDVNFLLFEVLPALNRGVWVHFHDIFYPFEQPREWIDKGLFWNECYLLRAFLQHNDAFKVRLFTDLATRICGLGGRKPPFDSVLQGGGSMWLEKVL